jgi:hypothetical protein
MLYTSENSSLLLRASFTLIKWIFPQLYVVELEVPDRSPIYILPDKDYIG